MKTKRRVWPIALLFVSLIGSSAEEARAQVDLSRFFDDPVLVLRVGGHQSPVRSLVFTPDGSQILTGGMDKVINVWNPEADRSGPVRTLRPPYWRGPRGQINAMALSPRDDGDSQRLLAVAGTGVLGNRGEILLFRYPGKAGEETGEVVGQLPATAADGTVGPGHLSTVTGLAFTPDGRYLVSSSNDQTVMIWDVDVRKQIAVIHEEFQAEINAISLFGNGNRLVSAGNDGVVRVYNLAVKERPVRFAQYPREGRKPPYGPELRINAVAASPDNRWILVGNDFGNVGRFDANLAGNPLPIELNNDKDTKWPVLAIAISPDSSKFAISSTTRGQEGQIAALPVVTSSLQVRSMLDGKAIEGLPNLSNLITALAFSPDSKRLAFSGGDGQNLFVKDLAAVPAVPSEEIKGFGSSLWDVGYRVDGQAIRFARSRPVVVGQGADYEYFHLRGRYFFNPEVNEPAYRHARNSEAGWTITPVDPYSFRFTSAQGQIWTRSLDPINERRWWAYTVVPPGPGHPEPIAAVAADAGIVLWNLTTGDKTRIFDGHSGPVYAIASSVDGKWLLTGSADQTVRIWPLNGCNIPPRFGASFVKQQNGSWIVTEVTPSGVADRIALQKGHVVEELFLGKDGPAERADPDTFLPQLDRLSPSWMVTIYARMNGDQNQPRFAAATTKRDSPAASLFPGLDRRWVLWTPRGYYDSSADGDRKFLGWLTNRGTPAQLLAGRFDSIDKFELRFRQPKARQPNVLDRLLDTGDPIQAEAVAAVAAPGQPPLADPATSRLAVLELAPVAPIPANREIVVNQPTIPLRYRAIARAGSAGITRLWVEVNGRVVTSFLAENIPATRQAEGQREIPLGLEKNVRVSLVAIDERGVRREQSIDVTNNTPAPPATRPSRLVIVAIGAEEFNDRRFPSIRYAEDDCRDLAKFFGDRLIDPATGKKFSKAQIRQETLIGGKLTRAGVTQVIDSLLTKPDDGPPLGPGDLVVVVIESHYLDFQSRRLITTTEVGAAPAEPPSFSASDLANGLKSLSDAGCRMMVVVDAVHEIKAPAWETNIQEWVRQLQGTSRTITFIASDHGPSSPNGDGHRVFAQSILDSPKPKSAGRLKLKPGGGMSLFEFQRTVNDSVLQQSGRRQHAQCYLPDTISLQVPFLDPSPK